MNAPTKLIAFGAALAVVFGGAVLAGAAIDPDDPPTASDGHGGAEHATSAPADDHGAPAADDHSAGGASSAPADHSAHDAQPAGLAVADGAYTLRFERTHLPPSRNAPLRFRIVDARGRTVRDDFQVEHEKRLHLIVARRDTAVFRHVHPEQRADGSWTVDVDVSDAGVYRAFADFKIGGEQHTLATDLFVPGDFRPRELPKPATTDRAVDEDDAPTAIDVALDAPTIRAGRATTLRFAASVDGRPVDRLEPYLGAKGHLVALREGDLAYLHVHPTGPAPSDGDEHGADAGHDDAGAPAHSHGDEAAANPQQEADSEATFAATFPTAGRYRLFLQVRVDGRIRTTDYTVEVAR